MEWATFLDNQGYVCEHVAYTGLFNSCVVWKWVVVWKRGPHNNVL